MIDNPYRSPVATQDAPNLTGDDLCLSRVLIAFYYSSLVYLGYAMLLVADLACFWTGHETAASAIGWGTHGVYWLSTFLFVAAGFSLFVMQRSGWLQFLGLALLATAIFSGLFPYLSYVSSPDHANTWGAIVPGVVSSLGGTAILFTLRAVVGERNRIPVINITGAALFLMWLNMISFAAFRVSWVAVARAGSLVTPGEEAWHWTTWIVYMLSMFGDAVCYWLAVTWVREDVIRIEPPPEPESQAEPAEDGIRYEA